MLEKGDARKHFSALPGKLLPQLGWIVIVLGGRCLWQVRLEKGDLRRQSSALPGKLLPQLG